EMVGARLYRHQVGSQSKQERCLLQLRRDRSADACVDEDVTLRMAYEDSGHHRVPFFPRRAAAVREGGSTMNHPGRERVDRHTSGWGCLRQWVRERRWCRERRGRVAAKEKQECNVGRQGKATRDPVAPRDDPAIARQDGYRKRYARSEKERGRSSDIQSSEQGEQGRTRN